MLCGETEFLLCVGGLRGSGEMEQLDVFVGLRVAVAGGEECQILPCMGWG